MMQVGTEDLMEAWNMPSVEVKEDMRKRQQRKKKLLYHVIVFFIGNNK